MFAARAHAKPLKPMTALNCKVGDLAIVVATELPQNLGQIVEVLGLQTGKPLGLSGLGHIWQVRAVSGRSSLVYRFNDTGKIVTNAEGPAPDRCLRPVSGVASDDGADANTSLQLITPRRRAKPRVKSSTAQ